MSTDLLGRGEAFLGEFVGPEQLDVGSYWLEVGAPADFRGTVIVRIWP